MVVTFLAYDLGNLFWILTAIAVGAVVGVLFARRVAMTAMPQLVALFNGVGGGAAALVALLELAEESTRRPSWRWRSRCSLERCRSLGRR